MRSFNLQPGVRTGSLAGQEVAQVPDVPPTLSRTDSDEIEHLRRQQRQGVRIDRGALEQARDDLNTSVRYEPMSSSNLRLG